MCTLKALETAHSITMASSATPFPSFVRMRREQLVYSVCCECYRAATFNVAGCKTTKTPLVTWQESSNFYSDLRIAISSELMMYYCVNCHCSTVIYHGTLCTQVPSADYLLQLASSLVPRPHSNICRLQLYCK